MCTRFDSEVNSHTSTRKLVTTLVLRLTKYQQIHPDIAAAKQQMFTL